ARHPPLHRTWGTAGNRRISIGCGELAYGGADYSAARVKKHAGIATRGFTRHRTALKTRASPPAHMAARLHFDSSRKEGRHVRSGHRESTTSSESRNAADLHVDDGTGTRRDGDSGVAGSLRRGADPRDPDDDGVRRPSSASTRTTAATDATARAGQADRAGVTSAINEQSGRAGRGAEDDRARA